MRKLLLPYQILEDTILEWKKEEEKEEDVLIEGNLNFF